MIQLHRACRLSIYVGNADVYKHKAVSGEVLRRAHHAGLSGATTLQGVEGFGHSSSVHSTPRWSLTDRTPTTIHLIDSHDKIRGFLPQLDDLAGHCLVVCDDVDIVGPADS